MINRGNRRADVFHAEGHYQTFVALLKEAGERDGKYGHSAFPPHLRCAHEVSGMPLTSRAKENLVNALFQLNASRVHLTRSTGSLASLD